MANPVFLDYNATTPMDPRVLEAMMPWFLSPSNAGSRTHVYGQRAKDAVENAREQIACHFNARPEEVVFTSGATESNNIAILGIAATAEKSGKRHIVSTTIEHKSVLEPLETLRRRGFEVDLVPVTPGGYVEQDAIASRVRPDTLLVSMMHANNETGVLQPVLEVAGIVRNHAVLLHVDAAQTFGKEVESLKQMNGAFVSLSGHKIGGPKGIGALLVKRRLDTRFAIAPIMFGGGQERGLRPGTLPVPLIVGLGEAARLADAEYLQRRAAAAVLKQHVLSELSLVEHRINGDLATSQPHVINVCFPGVDSEALMLSLRDELAFSNGSACTSASYQPSHVLTAMGLNADDAECSVRLSWGQGIEKIPTQLLIKKVLELR